MQYALKLSKIARYRQVIYMHEHSLRHPLLSVVNGIHSSYGGSQRLSHSNTIKGAGCGLVAVCDLFKYLNDFHPDCSCEIFDDLQPGEAIDVRNYNRLLDKLRSYFPIIPKLGINGVMLSLGINAFFLHYGYPYVAVWGVSPKNLWLRIAEMLDRDIPVIIGVGPNFPLIWQKHKTNLYAERAGDIRKVSSVKSHFMTVTGMDEKWLILSSWGRKYYIDRNEYREYVSKHSGSFASNIVYIKSK